MDKTFSILHLSRRARSARLLSYALLFLFAYNTTAEAVHNHRNTARTITAATSGFLTDGGGLTQRRAPAQTGECLVCQFQQNLSSVELFTPLLVLVPANTLPVSGVAAVSFLSLTTSTGQGRAPPVIS